MREWKIYNVEIKIVEQKPVGPLILLYRFIFFRSIRWSAVTVARGNSNTIKPKLTGLFFSIVCCLAFFWPNTTRMVHTCDRCAPGARALSTPHTEHRIHRTPCEDDWIPLICSQFTAIHDWLNYIIPSCGRAARVTCQPFSIPVTSSWSFGRRSSAFRRRNMD